MTDCSVEACMDRCDRDCYGDAQCTSGSLLDHSDEPYTDEQLAAMKVVSVIAAVVSVLGSAFVIRTFHLVQSHRPVALHIVYFLSISDLIASFAYIIDGTTTANEQDSPNCPNGLCVFLAAASQFFGMAAIAWNTLIAVNMHLTVVLAHRIVQSESKYLHRLHGCAWGAAALTTLVTGAAGGLGSAGQWCWITTEANWARLVCYYLPLICSLVYSLVVYLLVRQRLLNARKQASAAGDLGRSSALPELMTRFQWFLCVYGLIHCFRIANRLQEVLAPGKGVYTLAMLHALFGPLQGLGSALVYGWTPRVRRLYAQRYPAWCGCLEEKRTPQEHVPPSLAVATSGNELATVEAKPSI